MLEICCVTNELIPQKKHILAFQFFLKKGNIDRMLVPTPFAKKYKQ